MNPRLRHFLVNWAGLTVFIWAGIKTLNAIWAAAL